jgi:hypothetical protein
MPGRPKKNDRKREEGEAPKGKKMSKHGVVIKCGSCGISGHNKGSCKANPDRGKKKNAFLAKAGRKMKANEVNRALFLMFTDFFYFHCATSTNRCTC